ncbi:GNAT family N-acetyltransferase [Sphingomonas sp. LT1P40]|uniref:GNAT family N-acetyltransferase n=1 Tax=Alteristakelama amylovorans TaxID=3096166 RepID=UPI002FC895CF
MGAELADRIAEAYRWHHALGNSTIDAGFCRIVANPAIPRIWDANHADGVIIDTAAGFTDLLAVMDRELAHCPDRMVHTDHRSPPALLAMLALADFREQLTIIQMALTGPVRGDHRALHLHPVVTDANWTMLADLVATDYAEGARSGGVSHGRDISDALVAGYRAKGAAYRFHLVIEDDEPVAYGASVVCPDGIGMIEDLYTHPEHRRRGIASALIAEYSTRLVAVGCDTIFLGAITSEPAKHLYHRLGFQPVALARAWLREG